VERSERREKDAKSKKKSTDNGWECVCEENETGKMEITKDWSE
jgi:hypothetical protein